MSNARSLYNGHEDIQRNEHTSLARGELRETVSDTPLETQNVLGVQQDELIATVPRTFFWNLGGASRFGRVRSAVVHEA